MSTPEPELLRYAEVGKRFAIHPVRDAEIPMEHYVSSLLPTSRFGAPGWAGFGCPAHRSRTEPTKVGTPDRWWVVDARRSRLLSYNLVSAVPFSENLPEGPVVAVANRDSVAAAMEDAKLLEELMEEAAPAFFGGADGDATVRQDLAEAIDQALPAGLLPWYQALTPDFFEWLGR